MCQLHWFKGWQLTKSKCLRSHLFNTGLLTNKRYCCQKYYIQLISFRMMIYWPVQSIFEVVPINECSIVVLTRFVSIRQEGYFRDWMWLAETSQLAVLAFTFHKVVNVLWKSKRNANVMSDVDQYMMNNSELSKNKNWM